MLCPVCGAESLVWDYERGYIVCQSCGAVVEQLFEEHCFAKPMSTNSGSEAGIHSVRMGLEKKKRYLRERALKEKSSFLKRYEELSSRARKNVVVNVNALINGGRIFVHVKERELHQLLSEDHELREVLEKVVESDPVLSSRTFRGKVALAMMIKNFRTKGTPCIDEVCKVTGISKTHARRLLALLRRRARTEII